MLLTHPFQQKFAMVSIRRVTRFPSDFSTWFPSWQLDSQAMSHVRKNDGDEGVGRLRHAPTVLICDSTAALQSLSWPILLHLFHCLISPKDGPLSTTLSRLLFLADLKANLHFGILFDGSDLSVWTTPPSVPLLKDRSKHLNSSSPWQLLTSCVRFTTLRIATHLARHYPRINMRWAAQHRLSLRFSPRFHFFFLRASLCTEEIEDLNNRRREYAEKIQKDLRTKIEQARLVRRRVIHSADS